MQLAKLAWKRLLNKKVATVAAVVAGLAAFLGNIDVIEKFFGWGQPEPIKIVLSVLGSEAGDAPGSYVLHLKYTKTGSDSARDCRVEAWRGSFRTTLQIAGIDGPFTLPAGEDEQKIRAMVPPAQRRRNSISM